MELHIQKPMQQKNVHSLKIRVGDYHQQSLPINLGLTKHHISNSNLRKFCCFFTDPKSLKQPGNTCGLKDSGNDVQSSIEELISMTGDIKIGQRSRSSGLSISDTEVDYRRGRSVREGNGHLSWN